MAKNKGGDAAIKADEEWRVESDLRTVMEAAAIRNDKSRYAKVKAMAKQKMLQAAAVAGEAGEG